MPGSSRHWWSSDSTGRVVFVDDVSAGIADVAGMFLEPSVGKLLGWLRSDRAVLVLGGFLYVRCRKEQR